jgi:DNA polymerase/3'-5' exonuclease PolX
MTRMTPRRQLEMPDSWEDPLAHDDGPAEKVKFDSRLALDVAADLCPLFMPLCAEGDPARLLKVCGSLRRRKQMVGDVEIVFAPRVVCVKPEERDLLGELLRPAVHEPATHALLDDLVSRGVLRKRVKCNGALTGWGQWNRFATHVESGIPVDFFGCTEASFWNTVVCRTGGKVTNTRICMAAQAMGWHWEPSPEEAGFQRRVGLAIERHAVTSEREVFEFVGMDYQEPWERE